MCCGEVIFFVAKEPKGPVQPGNSKPKWYPNSPDTLQMVGCLLIFVWVSTPLDVGSFSFIFVGRVIFKGGDTKCSHCLACFPEGGFVFKFLLRVVLTSLRAYPWGRSPLQDKLFTTTHWGLKGNQKDIHSCFFLGTKPHESGSNMCF